MQRKKGISTYTCILICCFLLGVYGSTMGTNPVGIIAMLVLSWLLLLKDSETGFLILIAMIPYGDCWMFGGYSVRGIMCILPLFMLLRKGRIYRKKQIVLLAGVLLLMTELFNDLGRNDVFSIMNTMAPIIYLVLFSSVDVNQKEWNLEKMGYMFVASTLISDFMNLYVGGGFQAYNNAIAWYRFGQESSVSYLSGAMEIPIFSVVSIYFLLTALLRSQGMTFIIKLFHMILIGMNLLFGIMTLSRVFVLGMLVLGLIFIIKILSEKRPSVVLKAVASIVVALLFVYVLFGDLASVLVNKLQNRFLESADVGSGRTFIWSSCIEYLTSHAKAFLVGEGILSYPQIGTEMGESFSYFAHNFFLDVLMSVGFLGAVCLIIIVSSMFVRKKSDILAIGLLLCLMSMFFVSGTLQYIRSYIYIIFAVLFCNNLKEAWG